MRQISEMHTLVCLRYFIYQIFLSEVSCPCPDPARYNEIDDFYRNIPVNAHQRLSFRKTHPTSDYLTIPCDLPRRYQGSAMIQEFQSGAFRYVTRLASEYTPLVQIQRNDKYATIGITLVITPQDSGKLHGCEHSGGIIH